MGQRMPDLAAAVKADDLTTSLVWAILRKLVFHAWVSFCKFIGFVTLDAAFEPQ
jgi:hypothetical protein